MLTHGKKKLPTVRRLSLSSLTINSAQAYSVHAMLTPTAKKNSVYSKHLISVSLGGDKNREVPLLCSSLLQIIAFPPGRRLRNMKVKKIAPQPQSKDLTLRTHKFHPASAITTVNVP